jgi:hypothetical protein
VFVSNQRRCFSDSLKSPQLHLFAGLKRATYGSRTRYAMTSGSCPTPARVINDGGRVLIIAGSSSGAQEIAAEFVTNEKLLNDTAIHPSCPDAIVLKCRRTLAEWRTAHNDHGWMTIVLR